MSRMHLRFTAILYVLLGSACLPDAADQVATLPDLPILVTGGFGQEPGQFEQLGPSTVDSRGYLIVADNRLRRLTWLDLEGSPVRVLYYNPEAGSPSLQGFALSSIQALAATDESLYAAGLDHLWSIQEEPPRRIELQNLPAVLRDLTVSRDGEFFYVLTDRNVSLHRTDGSQISLWRLQGEPNPGARFLALGPNGTVYVSARRWQRVVVLNFDGTTLHTVGEAGIEPGRFRGSPAGIAVDEMGNVFACDGGDAAIEIFDAVGNFLRQIGSRGSEPGQSLNCGRVLIDRERSRLILADSGNYRFQVYDLDVHDRKTRDLVKHSPTYPPGPQPDHVVLTLGRNPHTERRVNWRTEPAIKQSRVQLAALSRDGTADSLDWESSLVVRIEGISDVFHANLGPYAYHEAELTNLTPGTRYAYRVGDGSSENWSPAQVFAVPDLPDARLRAVVLGDSRNRMDVWGKIVNTSSSERPAFLINTGDLVADGQDMNDWDMWFHEAKDVFSRIPLMPSLGNHERQSPNYFNAFALPPNDDPELNEQCYSFDYGPAHWIVLNTEIDLQKQAEWLETDLRNNSKTWTFAFFHRPAYAGHPTRGDGNVDVREAWTGLFEEYGVDIVWQGHDHYYFRTKPIRQRVVVEPGAGPIYVTTGGAGAPLYPIQLNQYAEVAESVDHYCILDVTPERCQVSVQRADGSLLDQFVLAPRMRDSWPPAD